MTNVLETTPVRNAGGKRWLVVIPEPLSARVFLDSGVISQLVARRQGALEIYFASAFEGIDDWIRRNPSVHFVGRDQVTSAPPSSFWARLPLVVDRALDRQIGFMPLAIRFNLRNKFHLERMTPGHNNYFLDLARIGFLPQWGWIYRLMFRWLFNRSRYIDPKLLAYLRQNTEAIILSNLQSPSVMPYILAGQRLGLPVFGYVASWDHPVGKGVMYRGCAGYAVQNDIMQEDLVRYHGIDPARICVTGWPQNDVFFERRPRAAYDELLRSYGLDPAKPCVLVTGNTHTNSPYEPAFLRRLMKWWVADNGAARFNLLFRPHPKDKEWRERFDVDAWNRIPGAHVQARCYTDIEVLALLLQNVNCVLTNAGTILLDSLVNDRPAISVLYDEGAPEGSAFAIKNMVGEHYRELMESKAFHRAASFEEVTKGIAACLEHPDELARERLAVTRRVAGKIDGQAATRVVESIISALAGGAVKDRGAPQRH